MTYRFINVFVVFAFLEIKKQSVQNIILTGLGEGIPHYNLNFATLLEEIDTVVFMKLL